MARKPKAPEVHCRKCAAPVVVLRVGGRYRDCDPAQRAIVVDDKLVKGYALHVCANKAPRTRRRKVVDVPELPLGQEAQAAQ